MQKQTPEGKDVPVPRVPTPSEAVETGKRQAEMDEVAGRHKNSGQKDHKGAR